MIRTLLSAAVLSAGLIATPAMAGGSVSLSLHPSGGDEARILQTGMRLYALSQNIKDGRIKQKGRNNSAGLQQNGRGNLGIVHQEGRGHEGTVRQNGNGNAYGLFQFGKNTSAHVEQNGHNQSGATFQFGW
ncbi:curlin [Chelativorans sp. YIM 93263]|uniref:curlin n=1 Tax=Chelativorans sp. YIM 93263 TaxID=2906648 RepID=UPI002379180C|nr:curlin [Chelativorans sp. YIM 93263]